jgi:hypothetical protein
MSIRGQSLVKSALAHQYEANGVAQRIAFVGSSLQQPDGFLAQSFLNPDDFNLGVSQEGREEKQGFTSRQPARVRQGHELREHKTVRQLRPGGLKKGLRVIAPRLVAVVKAEKAGSVK